MVDCVERWKVKINAEKKAEVWHFDRKEKKMAVDGRIFIKTRNKIWDICAWIVEMAG